MTCNRLLAKSAATPAPATVRWQAKEDFRLVAARLRPRRRLLQTITREARGRRVELSDPGRSLILAKPTGALPHKGGLKLDCPSRDYRVLSQWIASGAEGAARG